MKQGRTLVELAAELTRQQGAKKDYIADTRELSVLINPAVPIAWKGYALQVNGHGAYGITNHTHTQIAQRLGIPQKYYDRMAVEAPNLFKNNLEHWLHANPERRMIRTMDHKARAFLSDRYRPLDNFDLAEAVLPVLQEANGIQIMSTEVTERRLYVKAVFPKIQAEVTKGDIVQSGIVITNSEIGLSAVKIEPLVYRLVCLNGLIAPDYTTKKYHVGRAAEGGELAYELYRDETIKADDKAFWMKVQDTVRGSLEQAHFARIVDRMREAADDARIVDPVKSVEVFSNLYNLTREENNSVLKHLLSGGDLSRWGMINAVTAASQDLPDYDRATDFERLGGNVLVLPRSDWKVLAEAA
jgi:hypothetical protein